jgi:UDP-glucose 4-epimerase
MKVLVIGGNGFIGSHLIDQLLIEGHDVRVYDISYERYRKPLSNVDYRISTMDNIPDLYEALLGIDIIFHLASSTVPSTSNIDTVSDINKNLIPTLNLLNLMVKLGIKRIVYFSSGGAIYGHANSVPIIEDHPLHPISSYGVIKATVEMYLFLYQRLYNIKPLIIRPSNPFGPRQGHYMAQGVISTFLRKVKLNESLIIFGDGNSKKDYIYINDLISACLKLSFSNEIGTFNVGSGSCYSVNEIIAVIKEKTGKELFTVNSEMQKYDVDHFELDITKLKRVTGNHKFIPLDKGIEMTWNWILSID